MSRVSSIALLSVVLAVCASPAAAGLIISFSATPSVIDAGQAATLELVLTPVFSELDVVIGLGQLSFESGDGQTIDLATGGQLLEPLTLRHAFTYASAGTFTATTRGAISEQHRDPSGFIIISDYFFDNAPLTTNVTVVGVPTPGAIALLGFAVLAFALLELLPRNRRRQNIT